MRPSPSQVGTTLDATPEDGSTGDTQSVSESGQESRVLTAVVIVLSAMVLNLAAFAWTMFGQRDHVANLHDVRTTQYGFPLTWITQDQSVFVQKPSWPTNATLASPLENPSDINRDILLLDIAIVGAAPTAAYLVVSRTRRVTRRSKPMFRPGPSVSTY
jgi:hypothetical protein